MSAVINAKSFNAGLDAHLVRFHQRFRRRIIRILRYSMISMLRRTPVNTGRAAMNYVATAKAPYGGPAKKAGPPVEATNDLALGAEQLRAGAEAISLATLNAVDVTDPYQDFYITNRASNISGLEHGELPDEPYVPRSPQGMFRVTLREVSAMLQGGRL